MPACNTSSFVHLIASYSDSVYLIISFLALCQTYRKALSGHVHIPDHFSMAVANLIKKLLHTDQSKRLGRTVGGSTAVMFHRWYTNFDWVSCLMQFSSSSSSSSFGPRLKSLVDLPFFVLDMVSDNPLYLSFDCQTIMLIPPYLGCPVGLSNGSTSRTRGEGSESFQYL